MSRRAAHYTPHIANLICEQIALGKTLQQALEEVGYIAPKLRTVWIWFETHPDFKEKYDRARKLQADMQADRMIELGEAVLKAPKAATAYKVAIDVLKWQAEVRNRAKYGSKADDVTPKSMDPSKIRAEIARLEKELGVAEKTAEVTPLRAVK